MSIFCFTFILCRKIKSTPNGEQLVSSIFLAVLGKKYPAEITLLHEDKKCSLKDEPAPDSKMNLDRFCFPNAVEDNDP